MSKEGDGGAIVPMPAADEDLAVDFVNTRYWRGSERPTEGLPDFPALDAWLRRSAQLPDEMLRVARETAEPEALIAEAIRLRETLYRIFAQLAEGSGPAERDLDTLNAALAAAPPRRRLADFGSGLAWSVQAAGLRPSADTLLGSVLWSAGDLLARAPRLRIRRCANEKCLWLFIDRSKAGTRRWCDMAACGNRAKARRHYLRTRVEIASTNGGDRRS